MIIQINIKYFHGHTTSWLLRRYVTFVIIVSINQTYYYHELFETERINLSHPVNVDVVTLRLEIQTGDLGLYYFYLLNTVQKCCIATIVGVLLIFRTIDVNIVTRHYHLASLTLIAMS